MLTRCLRLGSVDESRLERVALVWPPRHRLLATVRFTDIVDSTKHQQRLVTGNGVNCCSNTRRELARFRGREVNTAGDGFLIAFDGPRTGHPPWAEHLSAGTLVGHRHRVETLLETLE